jgi:hypothetical protein
MSLTGFGRFGSYNKNIIDAQCNYKATVKFRGGFSNPYRIKHPVIIL